MAIGIIRNIGGGSASSNPNFYIIDKISGVTVNTLTKTDMNVSISVDLYGSISPLTCFIFSSKADFTCVISGNVPDDRDRWQIINSSGSAVYNSTTGGSVFLPKGVYTFRMTTTRSFSLRASVQVVAH